MSTVPVCAHVNLGPFVHHHFRAESCKAAVAGFARLVEQHYGVLDKSIAEIRRPDEMPCVDLYPQCRECNSHMNFHDYPMVRHQVGPRGGIRRVRV